MPSTTKRLEPKRLALAGAAAGLAAVLVLQLLASNAEPRPAPALPPPPSAATPPPPTPPALMVEPQAAAPSAEGLRLYGLLGGGAIIALPDGKQRWVALGREVLPGLRVERIAQHHVVLVAASGETMLGFDGPRTAPPVPAETAGPAGAASSPDSLREETLRHRLGLAARRAGGRTQGFVVRAGVSMPALERAGLRPGDVILGVNGSGFDEERMLELAWQLANSGRTEFEVERAGRRIRLAVE